MPGEGAAGGKVPGEIESDVSLCSAAEMNKLTQFLELR